MGLVGSELLISVFAASGWVVSMIAVGLVLEFICVEGETCVISIVG